MFSSTFEQKKITDVVKEAGNECFFGQLAKAEAFDEPLAPHCATGRVFPQSVDIRMDVLIGRSVLLLLRDHQNESCDLTASQPRDRIPNPADFVEPAKEC